MVKRVMALRNPVKRLLFDSMVLVLLVGGAQLVNSNILNAVIKTF